MTEVKMKAGDLLTIKTEAVANDYDNGNDFENIVVEGPEDLSAFKSIEDLFDESIFKVVKNTSHKDIEEAGGNICYYSIEGERIESFTRPKKGVLRINGEYDIPTKGNDDECLLIDRRFLNERQAQAIATALNTVELKRSKKLRTALDKVIVMLGQIVDGKLV